MIGSPLATRVAFTIGTVSITTPVVTTWCIMAILAGGSWLSARTFSVQPSRYQTALEFLIETIDGQISDTMQVAPKPYLPLIGTLFIFIFVSNWSSLVPGVAPPTAHIETDIALSMIVFIAVIYYGFKVRGARAYLATFARPSIVMLPLNIIEQVTRTFSLVVRLFGNVMSGVFVIGIVVSLVGLLVPVPLMVLDLLTGAVQAYIFSVLAMVFIGGAVTAETKPEKEAVS